MDKYLFLQAMDKAGFKSQRDFAKSNGISHKVLSNQINNKTKVSTDDVNFYCKILGITNESNIVSIFLK